MSANNYSLIIIKLIEDGVLTKNDVLHINSNTGNNLLHHTINNIELFTKIIFMLNIQKDDIMIPNAVGHTLLMQSCASNLYDTAKFLIEQFNLTHDDIMSYHVGGKTALHFAVVRDNIDITLLLMTKGDLQKEDILMTFNNNFSAFELACLGGSYDIAALFISMGNIKKNDLSEKVHKHVNNDKIKMLLSLITEE